MIHFIHGDNLSESRSYLKSLIDQAKKESKEIVRLDGEKVKIEDFIQALGSQSLFGGGRTVVVENLFSRQRSNEQAKILNYVKQNLSASDIFFWEKKEIGKVLQRNLPPGAQVKLFKIPKLMFKFLDQFLPSDKKQALTTFHELVKIEAPELVFFMLARQIRTLILAFENQKINGAPWMKNKYQKQAQAFGLEKLLTIYHQLFTIDESIKKGKTIMPLGWHMELLIANL